MVLKRITPTEHAIYRLSEFRKELDLTITELRALLPRERPPKPKGYINDPVTGKKIYYKPRKH